VYSPLLLDHFEHPRNVGEIPDATATAQIENPACGDVLKLSLKIVNGRIAEVRFRAKGCVPAIACGSALTELVVGRSVAEAKKIGTEEVAGVLGGLPEASTHAGQLALDALAAALKKL